MRDPSFDLDAAIGSMPDSHLHCRDYGHSWRAFTAAWNAKERAYDQTLRCTRCRALRSRLLDSHGNVLNTNYTYPDSYLVRGMGRLTGDDRGMVRLASVRADIGRAGGEVE